MQIEVRPGLTAEQCAELLDAAVPALREQVLAGAIKATATSRDGETLTIVSDKLDAPKLVSIRESK